MGRVFCDILLWVGDSWCWCWSVIGALAGGVGDNFGVAYVVIFLLLYFIIILLCLISY